MTIPLAPADLSGGFMTINYNATSTDVHRMRVHLAPFSLSQFVTGSPETITSVDDGKHNFAYNPVLPGVGSENGVNDTFQAFCNLLRPFYPTLTSFSLLNLYQMQSGQPVEIFPTPAPTPIAGSSGAAAPVGQPRAGEIIYNFRTVGGHKARLILIGPASDWSDATPYTVTPTSGGDAAQQALIAYLSGGATGIVGHDGSKLNASAHVTQVVNRRLRRRMGFS
jgi:hypothetical protein